MVHLLQMLFCHTSQRFDIFLVEEVIKDWCVMLLRETEFFIYIYEVQMGQHFVGLNPNRPSLAEGKLSGSILTL